MVLAVSVRFDFRDDKGKTSHTKVRVPNGFSIAQYLEFGQGAAQVFANLSGCIVTKASITIGLDLSTSTIKAVAGSLSDIAHKAFFQFNTAVAGFRAKMKLPTLADTIVPSGSDAIDTADPTVAAFIAAMENGIVVTGGTVSPTDDRENDIVSTAFARELFQKK